MLASSWLYTLGWKGWYTPQGKQWSLDLVKWQVLEKMLTLYRHRCSDHHNYIHWDGKDNLECRVNDMAMFGLVTMQISVLLPCKHIILALKTKWAKFHIPTRNDHIWWSLSALPILVWSQWKSKNLMKVICRKIHYLIENFDICDENQ